jgi:hypothetical protein
VSIAVTALCGCSPLSIVDDGGHRSVPPDAAAGDDARPADAAQVDARPVALGERTRLPESAPGFSSVAVFDDRLIFVFTRAPTQDDLRVGDVVAGVTGGGYLRAVTSISIAGNTLTATTSKAALTHAIHTGEVHATLAAGEGDGWRAVGGLPTVELDQMTLFDGPSGPASVFVRFQGGSVSLHPEMTLSAVIETFRLRRFEIRVRGTLDIQLDVTATATGPCALEHETYLNGGAPLYVHPFQTRVGELPVVGEVQFLMAAHFSYEQSSGGEVTVGYDGSWPVEIGAIYDQDAWSPVFPSSVLSGSAHKPARDGSGDARLRLSLRPMLRTVFYGTVGPSLGLQAHADAVLSEGFPPSWVMRGGLGAHLGILLGDLSHEVEGYETDLPATESELGRGTLPGCGDGACAGAESCQTCSIDCGACPECTTSAQCNDGLPCTSDACSVDQRCQHAPIVGCCTSNSQCGDGKVCTSDVCDASNRCVNSPIQGCCLSDPQCDDTNTCTADFCDLQNHVCVHNNTCGACGNGSCEASEGCASCPQDCVRAEICNGIDDDCDGIVDDGCGGGGGVCGDGLCNASETCATCAADCCGGGCPPGRVQCGQICIDVQTDNANCGSCSHACPPGNICSAGQCL